MSVGGGTVPFGSVDETGAQSAIGSGLDFSGQSNPAVRLLPAPDGTLYAFNVGTLFEGPPGGSAPYSAFGTVDRSTGTFTAIGDLSTALKVEMFGGIKEPQFVFDGSDRLLAFGMGPGFIQRYGELNLVTGAFTSLVPDLPFEVSSVAEAADGTRYYVQFSGGQAPVPFGTVATDGTLTAIGGGLDFGTESNRTVWLMFSPGGTLYAFNVGGLDTGPPGQPAAPSGWGTVNPATGAFTRVGDLADAFKIEGGFGGAQEPYFWFDGPNHLYGTGKTYDFQTRMVEFDLTDGTATDLVPTQGFEVSGLAVAR